MTRAISSTAKLARHFRTRMRRYGRRTIIALPTAAISLFVFAAPAFADLKLCNRMHQVDERTPVSDLEKLTRIYRGVLDRYFG